MNIWQKYGQRFGGTFLWTKMYTFSVQHYTNSIEIVNVSQSFLWYISPKRRVAMLNRIEMFAHKFNLPDFLLYSSTVLFMFMFMFSRFISYILSLRMANKVECTVKISPEVRKSYTRLKTRGNVF